jgi:diadenosine tetraphosphate (Ap4A) HIT family hydrolase
MTECKTCELIERRDRGQAPVWDSILRTPEWDVVHAFGSAVEAWLVLVVRRHITSVASLTPDEATAMGRLIPQVSAAVQAVVGCDKTYVAQFAEHPEHPHVHVHVIPRARDLAHEHQGPRIFGLLGVPDDESVPEMRMNDLAAELRMHLTG